MGYTELYRLMEITLDVIVTDFSLSLVRNSEFKAPNSEFISLWTSVTYPSHPVHLTMMSVKWNPKADFYFYSGFSYCTQGES
jgi:hypothetical protein